MSSSNVASTWHNLEGPSNKIPKTHVSFAPHGKKGGHDTIPFSIMSVSEAIDSAKSSVFYAIMSPEGGGPVMPGLENLADRQELFSLGIIDKPGQLDLFKAGNNTGVTAYKAITKNVPEPFKKEMESREFHEGKLTGQVIHHKFVVCDFNDKNPVVFCGASNLSSGGEQNNGDNLLAIYDPAIATAYAIESIRLYDHYRFAGMQNSDGTETSSIRLKSTDEWVKPYYKPDNIKFKERQLLSSPLSKQ